MTTDFPKIPGKDPMRSTQRGASPSGEYERTPKDTPPAMPAQRDLERSTPTPITVERLVERLLSALGPTGAAERHFREILVEGIVAKMGQMTKTKVSTLVASNLLKILSEE